MRKQCRHRGSFGLLFFARNAKDSELTERGSVKRGDGEAVKSKRYESCVIPSPPFSFFAQSVKAIAQSESLEASETHNPTPLEKCLRPMGVQVCAFHYGAVVRRSVINGTGAIIHVRTVHAVPSRHPR